MATPLPGLIWEGVEPLEAYPTPRTTTSIATYKQHYQVSVLMPHIPIVTCLFVGIASSKMPC